MDSSASNQKIAWFKKEEQAGTLDLSPQFQRRPVWTEEQASYLIDTILSGLPIPEIYIRSSSTPSGETKYEVVDGQQRIRSVLQFGSNDLELVGNLMSAKWFTRSFEDLSDQEKTNFWDYKIVVRDVSGASDLEIRDLFKRLNIHSVILNNQELRHARFSGRFIKLMESLADDDWWIEVGLVNVRQIRRMEDVEYVSELFVALVSGPQDKKKTLDEYYLNFDGSMPEESEWTSRFRQVWDFIRTGLQPELVRKWNGKSDFYTLFLALASIAERKPKLRPEEREALEEVLAKFKRDVDQARRKDNKKKFSEDIIEYAEAVSRAATDLARREARLRILESRINRAISSVKVQSTSMNRKQVKPPNKALKQTP